MKKIAWIVPKTYISQSRVFKESNSLSSKGYKVKIFSLTQYAYGSDHEIENGIEIEKVDFNLLRKLNFPLHRRSLLIPFFTVKVLYKLKKFKPDLIYCMNLPSLHIGIIGKKFFKSKCVYDSHDLYIDQPRRKNSPIIVRKITMVYEKFLAKKADFVIQTTDSRCKQFNKYYGIEPLKIMNKPLPPLKDVKRPKSIDKYLISDKKIVGYVGSVLPHRGLEQLVEAVSDINNIQIVILGYARGKWAKNFIIKNKGKITLIPAVKPYEITTALTVFDIGISLIQNYGRSYYYSCPTKVFELIVAGIPQVASNLPEIERLIVGNPIGPVGKVVNPANIDEIRKAIVELIASPEEYNQYKQNCLKLKPQCLWKSEEEKLLEKINSLWN